MVLKAAGSETLSRDPKTGFTASHEVDQASLGTVSVRDAQGNLPTSLPGLGHRHLPIKDRR